MSHRALVNVQCELLWFLCDSCTVKLKHIDYVLSSHWVGSTEQAEAMPAVTFAIWMERSSEIKCVFNCSHSQATHTQLYMNVNITKMKHVCCRCCNLNTGVLDTTDLACICNEQTWNTSTYTHSRTQNARVVQTNKQTEVERGCGPENHCSFWVAVWGSVLWFWAKQFFMTSLPQIIQKQHPRHYFSAHYSKNRHGNTLVRWINDRF